MTVLIRMTRQLYNTVRADLCGRHPFAGERVGFLFGRLGNVGTASPIILFTGYTGLADDRYIDDPLSGARIDGQAIRSAMQKVIDRREGVFHVHMHEWPGKPNFSRMDHEELPRLIPSFQAVGPNFAQGLFLLSQDQCSAAVWLPNRQAPVEATRIGIVGYPLELFGGQQQ